MNNFQPCVAVVESVIKGTVDLRLSLFPCLSRVGDVDLQYSKLDLPTRS